MKRWRLWSGWPWKDGEPQEDIAEHPEGEFVMHSAAQSEIEKLRTALYDLVTAHNGYRHGVGPCICLAHENARKILGISNADEPPKRS